MKVFAVLSIILLFLASNAAAAIYTWTDEKGTVHAVGALEDVPAQYRGKVKVIEAAEERTPEPPAEEIPASPAEKEEEYYGDQPLSWWLSTFRKRKEEIEGAQKELKEKGQYVEVFEKGRRFGQVYSDEEVKTYSKYKTDIPAAEKRIENLKEELEGLRRRATFYGVPKEIRGE